VSGANGASRDGRLRRHRPREPIADAWLRLVALLHEPAAPWSRVQHEAMRKAFYWGAFAAFGATLAARTSADLDVIQEELNRYRASLHSDGKAG
jgi:hypothetical protein